MSSWDGQVTLPGAASPINPQRSRSYSLNSARASLSSGSVDGPLFYSPDPTITESTLFSDSDDDNGASLHSTEAPSRYRLRSPPPPVPASDASFPTEEDELETDLERGLAGQEESPPSYTRYVPPSSSDYLPRVPSSEEIGPEERYVVDVLQRHLQSLREGNRGQILPSYQTFPPSPSTTSSGTRTLVDDYSYVVNQDQDQGTRFRPLENFCAGICTAVVLLSVFMLIEALIVTVVIALIRSFG